MNCYSYGEKGYIQTFSEPDTDWLAFPIYPLLGACSIKHEGVVWEMTSIQ